MGTVKFKGETMHLEGELPRVGQEAPAFSLPNPDMEMKSLEDFKGKVLVLVTVPSLDTPICDLEVRRFNQEAASLSDKVSIVAVSRDLPFAQARWCAAAGVKAVTTLSDYRNGDFGKAYGVYIEELALLARAAFVISPEGIVRYVELVPEVKEHPRYEQIIEAIKKEL